MCHKLYAPNPSTQGNVLDKDWPFGIKWPLWDKGRILTKEM